MTGVQIVRSLEMDKKPQPAHLKSTSQYYLWSRTLGSGVKNEMKLHDYNRVVNVNNRIKAHQSTYVTKSLMIHNPQSRIQVVYREGDLVEVPNGPLIVTLNIPVECKGEMSHLCTHAINSPLDLTTNSNYIISTKPQEDVLDLSTFGDSIESPSEAIDLSINQDNPLDLSLIQGGNLHVIPLPPRTPKCEHGPNTSTPRQRSLSSCLTLTPIVSSTPLYPQDVTTPQSSNKQGVISLEQSYSNSNIVGVSKIKNFHNIVEKSSKLEKWTTNKLIQRKSNFKVADKVVESSNETFGDKTEIQKRAMVDRHLFDQELKSQEKTVIDNESINCFGKRSKEDSEPVVKKKLTIKYKANDLVVEKHSIEDRKFKRERKVVDILRGEQIKKPNVTPHADITSEDIDKWVRMDSDPAWVPASEFYGQLKRS